MPKPEPKEVPRSTLWYRVGLAVVLLVALSGLVLGPFYHLLTRPPVTLPPRIRAVEGNVLITKGWEPGDDGAYVLQTANGRSIALYCGPWPSTFPCLHRKGLESGGVYRLTIAYGSEVFPDGETRNIITHALYGDHELVTPEQQLRQWKNTTVFHDFRTGQDVAETLDALFWTLHAFLGAFYAMILYALIKNGLALFRARTAKRRT
jgi:hypothetical protein